MGANYSDEQREFIFSNFHDIALIKAYAGTGKSFTLKQYCKQHQSSTFLYFVYNKSMRIDAQKSFKDINNVAITTFHGIAFKQVGTRYKSRLDKEESLKSFDLIRFLDEEKIDPDEMPHYAHALLKTVQDFTSSSDTIDEYTQKHKKRSNLDTIYDYEMLAYVLGKLRAVWNEIVDVNNTKIPFEHDFYLKIFQLEKHKMAFDYILVDEAQDISPVMIDIILTQTHAKKIFVGDSFQSIYAWRGAVNSLNYLDRTYRPPVFYLSKSFRCPPRVGWLANRIIKLAGAEKDFVGVATPAPVTKQKTYIARTNSGLFGFCVENLDKKIYFVGGIKSYNFTDLLDVQNLLSKKHEYIRSEFISKFADFKELNKYSRDMNDISMIGTIGIVLKYMKKNLYSLIADIKEASTTKMSEADIVVTTAHKSKGLEWAQVELLDDFPFGSETKMERANVGEELRLLYVAVTRAMNNVRLPEEILDYLDIGGDRSEFEGTIEKAVVQEDEVASYEDIESEEDEEDHTELCQCTICNEGFVFDSGSKFYCEECDFAIPQSKIIKFFDTFKQDIKKDESRDILKTLITKEAYYARNLISKSNQPFNAVLVLENNKNYGWGIGFSDDKPKFSKKTYTKKRGQRKGFNPRPY